MSKPDNKFKTIQTLHLDGNSASVTFPVPPELEPMTRSIANIDLSIEHYLLARFSYFHRMERSYMINAFWAVEYLFLSILTFKYENLKALMESGMDLHNMNHYWKEIKTNLPNSEVQAMSQFDPFIGKIQGYYFERYQKDISKTKLTHTGKSPKVTEPIGSEDDEKTIKFGKVQSLNIDELDHFVNFMLHDIVPFKKDRSSNLQTTLMKYDTTDIYQRDNKFSMIYPNKKYHGELDCK